MIRVAINGFGRIGRYLIRASVDNPNVQIVAINNRTTDTKLLAHMLKYDSVHGNFNTPVRYDDEHLIVKGKRIKIVSETKDLDKLPWKDMHIDIVFETTGKYKDKKTNEGHIKAGAKVVIIGRPGKSDIDGTFVYGVNEEDFDPKKHKVISNASCTTNCLAPVLKVLNEKFGVVDCMFTTVHSYTMSQRILDGSHKDIRRSRAGALSMIPTTTGAAKATEIVLPELKGKLAGMAIRIPTPNVSLIDLVMTLKKGTSATEINEFIKTSCNNGMQGIVQYSEEELVSIDFVSSPYSSIVDLPLTMMLGKDKVKMILWYDNESGYAHRMLDLGLYVANVMRAQEHKEESE